MRTIERSGRFRQDFKREMKGKSHDDAEVLEAELREVIYPLATGIALPQRYCDHPLRGGKWKGCRECHVRPDLLLIYRTRDDDLELVRLGSYSGLKIKGCG